MTSPRPPQDPSTPEQALRASALALGGGPDDLQLVTGRPGVGVLALPDEAVRLRVAPLGVDRRQLERVHRLLAAPAMVEAAVAPVPRGLISIVESEGYHVEVTSWADGRDWTNGRVALLSGSAVHRPLPVPAGGLPLLARTVAAGPRRHRGERRGDPALLQPPRLRPRAARHLDPAAVPHRRVTRARGPPRPLAQGRREGGAGAGAVLDAAGYLEGFPLVAANRQLWPAHVVADRQRLTLVDWTRAVAGSPLLDIAQIVTHFNGWDTASSRRRWSPTPPSASSPPTSDACSPSSHAWT
jgi:hypothetical protein